MKHLLVALGFLASLGTMKADIKEKLIGGVLKDFQAPEDWVITAEASYHDSTESRVVVRRSLVLDITDLIPEGTDLPNDPAASVESRRFFSGLARRFRDDVCSGLVHLTADEFRSMDLDIRANASPTTTVFYNRDCVVTVMSEFNKVREGRSLWSVHFTVAFDVPKDHETKTGEQVGHGDGG